MTAPSAQDVKAKARDLGADLVGIAAASVLAEHPVPGCPNGPEEILRGARSVVVLARRLLWGMAREPGWDNRNVHYAGELALTRMEDLTYEVGRFLEDHDFPSLIVPSAYSRSHQVEIAGKALALPHLAVEAGLGTLGLGLQLLTPEYGPRVVLGAVVTQAALEPDRRRQAALCWGEGCGRCLLACPGDAIGHFALDLERCVPYSAPFGYHFVQQHVERILAAPDPAARMEHIQSMDTFMIWQSMLRGVGVYTGCTRCADVCPVGADYEAHLREIQEQIPETTPDKAAKLRGLQGAAARAAAAGLRAHARWIGTLPAPAVPSPAPPSPVPPSPSPPSPSPAG
jgi:epoxyqueuosine reductase